MATITDIRWIVFKEDGQDETRISDSMTIDELLEKMKSKDLFIPQVNRNEELSICYHVDSRDVCVPIENYTSDKSEEWFSYGVDSAIVLECVRIGWDFVYTYHNAVLMADGTGEKVSMEEYIRQIHEKYGKYFESKDFDKLSQVCGI